MRRLIKILDYLLDRTLLVLCMCLFLAGLYSLYDSYMVYAHATDGSLLKFKPGTESGEEDTEQVLPDNMIAWLTVDNTNIDYPIMQGEDNTEYLNKDPYGEYSLSGSIFLDSRNDPDFKDFYSLVYGHHMERDAMFGSLDHFMDRNYFQSHRTGTLTINNTPYNLYACAVLEADASTSEIFAPTENNGVLDYLQKHSLIIDKNALPDSKRGEKLLALSTCKFPDTLDRTIVMFRIQEQ